MGAVPGPCWFFGDALVECRAADATDREVMEFAAAQGIIVLTHDLDFGTILAASKRSKPSVVQIRSESLQPGIIGGAVLSGIRSAAAELEIGAFVSVNPGRTRVRILPLNRP